MELDDVVLNTCGAENRPELHCRFRGQLAEVASQSTDVFFAEFFLADFFCFNLLNHRTVLVEGEGSQSVFALTSEKLSNRHNPFVVLSEVVESDSSFEADEGLSKGEHFRTSFFKVASTCEHIVQSLPATTAGIALVRLDITLVLKVITILVDEVPDQGVNIVLTPVEPVLNRRVNVPN